MCRTARQFSFSSIQGLKVRTTLGLAPVVTPPPPAANSNSMPRIFLPTVTPKNNALLPGSTQQEQSADFDLSESDQDSTTDDQDSPNLLSCASVGEQHPAVLPQQEKESEGGRSNMASRRSRAEDGSLEEPASKRPKQHGRGRNGYSSSSSGKESAPPVDFSSGLGVVDDEIALGSTGRSRLGAVLDNARALPTEAVHSTPAREVISPAAHPTPTIGAAASKSRDMSGHNRFTSATPTATT
ncbi:unnamed protein product, partial [Ectocarpus fasciculatus]